MHDIRRIREAPEAFDAMLARRGLAPLAAEVLALDQRRRAAQTAFQEMQARRNALSKRIGAARGRGEDAAPLQAEAAAMAEAIAREEAEEKRLGAELDALLATIPNWLDDAVPTGGGEADNVVLRSWGEQRRFDFTPLQHFDLGERLGLMDFEAAARLAGSRFVVLKGALARLERALGQFMLDLQTAEHGYTEVNPPLLVREAVLYGTGQLPKFRDDQFATTDGRWLIPTAEVPLTNLARERILAEADLPIRLTALTPCFRAEAGSAGRDVRGMLRQHQFMKVELVSITAPEQSDAEHARMTAAAEAVLQRLGLAYRVVDLCSADIGFGATRTFDLEVWLPGQGAYREISSCSNCRDFQARRMDARYRPDEGKGTRFVHTLNGSGVAVGRALIAVMETYQRADGGIDIPEALRPYMGGLTAIAP
ncbi:serine--tRNA ligase [Elioraea sp. Yellowstone]|jgi:seryl-tRNA synthetase|uniref:serine--tRNA ligase n=1 Tax=Elioraea sp. Yellowstone TaxID=2592070 RepID=UPI001151184D|nr:serine--tRNA ligase [Elioraea sp. Yellowstone]TQF77064.1 serine--tRNA ligase [Elioraea sp. Yellowstone]